MKEIKVQIPDNYELIKDGDTYIIKEKKQAPPRSWEEFCKNYPRTTYEYFIRGDSSLEQIYNNNGPRNTKRDKNICTSKEEAKAFLALMQLRQLRKAWIGDWEYTKSEGSYGIIAKTDDSLEVGVYGTFRRNMLFPTRKMAEDFLNCFKDLCETAKILL